MSFDWNEYIKLAEKLIEKDVNEAVLRTAIHNLYYGAFNQCKEYKNVYVKHNIHKAVIEIYKNSDDVDEQEIGSHLYDLRYQRNKSDYEKISL